MKVKVLRRGGLAVVVAGILGLGLAMPASALQGTYSCTSTRSGAAVVTASATKGSVWLGPQIPNANTSQDEAYSMRIGTNTYYAPTQKGGWMTVGGTPTRGYGTCIA